MFKFKVYFIIFLMVCSFLVSAQTPYVTHSTEGLISSNQAIVIRFSEPVNIEVDSKKPEQLITVYPRVNGSIEKINMQTLAFIPDLKFKNGQTYSYQVNLQNIFGDNSLKQYTNNFIIPENKINVFNWEILPASGHKKLSDAFLNVDNLQFLRFHLKFDSKIDVKSLLNNLFIKYDSRNLKFFVKENKNDKEFIIDSETIKKTGETKDFSFTIENQNLNILEDFSRNLSLPGDKEVKVINISHTSINEDYGVKITFNQPLESSDFDGYVKIEPYLDFNINHRGAQLYLEGNFKPGKKYKINVMEGIKGKSGNRKKQKFNANIELPDISPQINFIDDGIYKSSAYDTEIGFKSINVKKVNLRIKKVFSDNLTFFLQNARFKGSAGSNYTYNVRRTGKTVFEKEVTLNEQKNEWFTGSVSLPELSDYEGIYIVELQFNDYQDKATLVEKKHYGACSKPVIFSDFAISAIKARNKIHAFVMDVNTGRSLSGVKLELYSYQNQLIESVYTNRNGKAVFNSDKGFYISGIKDNVQTILKFTDSAMDLSNFDISGTEEDSKTNCFIYTDREVHRPGDTIYLNAVLRNNNNSFPENHPVTLTVYDSLNRRVIKTTKNKVEDGFYFFEIETENNAPTGIWRAQVSAGPAEFVHDLRIETIVPHRLSLDIQTDFDKLTRKDENFTFSLESEYLSGASAAFLKTEAGIEFIDFNKKFEDYRHFTFRDKTSSFSKQRSEWHGVRIDENNEAEYKLPLNFPENVPSSTLLKIEGKVFEEGGRNVKAQKLIPVDFHNYYAGIKIPGNDNFKQDDEVEFEFILLDNSGLPVSGREMTYRIYKQQQWWWYDYDSENKFRKNFRKSPSTELVKEGEFISGIKPESLFFTPSTWGHYLIELEDKNGSHKTSEFFTAYTWGHTVREDSSIIEIGTDKTDYEVGEKARLSVVAPENGKIIIFAENEGKIVYKKFINIETVKEFIEIDITEDMVPNTYLGAIFLNPLNNKENDLPLRLFGLSNINVVDNKTVLNPQINIKDEIKPGEEFTVDVNLDKPSQLTLAVVDEGLHSITNEKVPDPWKYFFRKRSFQSSLHDTLKDVIIPYELKPDRVFTFGGGDEPDSRERRLLDTQAQRFEPVVLHSGIIKTDDNGRASINMKMPDYSGAVRLTVVAVSGNSYGSSSKIEPVKDDLMVLPSFPRVLSPGDEFKAAINIFSTNENVKGDVDIYIKTTHFLKPAKSHYKVQLEPESSKTLWVDFKVLNKTGAEQVKIKAESSQAEFVSKTEIDIRPQLPFISESNIKKIKSEIQNSIEFPYEGVEGSTNASISIFRTTPVKLEHRLQYLLNYPFGCLEQTVSSVFNNIYIPSILEMGSLKQRQLEKRVDQAISRLRKFIVSNGGFSMWPGRNSSHSWVTTYAGHFLTEARNNGYFVPDDLFNHWVNYEKIQARNSKGDLTQRVYRVFVSSLSKNFFTGEMNLLYQNYLDKLSYVQKTLLAGAFYNYGRTDIASEIFNKKSSFMDEFQVSNFGSKNRNLSLVLSIYSNTNRREKGRKYFEQIVSEVNSEKRFSPQTLAFMLMGVSSFLRDSSQATLISGRLIFDKDIDEEIYSFKPVVNFNIPEEYIKNGVKLNLDGEDDFYASVNWQGIPLNAEDIRSVNNNIDLKVKFLDSNGQIVSLNKHLKQTQYHYILFEVVNPENIDLSEVALMQILPSGIEAVNPRLYNEDIPAFAKNYNLGSETFMDLRDDRVIYYFDLEANKKAHFLLKVNPVTPGKFFIPPTTVEAMYSPEVNAIFKFENNLEIEK
ncbi:MAG: alpha-2-macroglobulin family protein [Candidatus Muiribacteriota bacterium]